jgi:LCP family protein required for cell wall assembly
MSEPGVPKLAWNMWKRFLLGGVIIVLAAAGTTATASLLQVKNIADQFNRGTKPDTGHELTPAEAGAPQTILVLGSDTRIADRRAGVKFGNSDTMLLIRMDPHKHATALLSIPRDLKVQIPHDNGVLETAKINAAYALGGPKLVLKVIKRVLNIKVNHVVNVNFGGFRRAVDYVGCVYVDIDRRYFNANARAYAEIDVRPGYQKMCGQKALDYVRFRHEDTDLVRSARQQDFLRWGKDQVGVQRLIDDRNAFAKIFGQYSQTDIRGTAALLSILKLAAFSAGQPVRDVHFQTVLGPSFVESSPKQLLDTRNEFLNADSSANPRGSERNAPPIAGQKRKKRKASTVKGLEQAKTEGENAAIPAQLKLKRLRFYYPTLRLAGSVYTDVPRTYTIPDLKGVQRQAYRMVVRTGELGAFYGIQGLAWKDPPALDGPDEKRMVGKRELLLFRVGDKLRLVGFKTPNASYWVSNTLLLSLTNKQMVGIASSMRPI